MPAKWHNVSPDMWNRNTRRMSKDAVIALVYIRTCPHRLTEGLFQLAPDHVAADTPLTVDEAAAALDELVDCGEIAYDDHHEYVFDRRALRDYPLTYGTNKDGERKPDNRLAPFLTRLDAMPDTELKRDLAEVAWETSDALAEALAERGIFQPDDGPTGSPLQAPSEPLDSPSEGTSRDRARVEPESEPSWLRVGEETDENELRCENDGKKDGPCHGAADPRFLEDDGTAWCGWCAPSALRMAVRMEGAS